MELKDSVFIVTGGSSGIGKATAKLLIDKGANVAITGRDRSKLNQVADEIGAFAIQADVAKEADVKKTYTETLSKFGKLDGLINNAGIGGWCPIDELDLEEMKRVYSVNVFGAAMMAGEAAKIFKEQKSGNIVNIASTASVKGYPKGTIYSSSKFALRSMSQCWQGELRPFNVRVIHVNPSEVTTAFGQDDRTERSEESNKLRSEEIAHTIVSSLEMDQRGFIPEVTVFATNPF
jgi:3-oxoacyl-[acyl-carrier protein] reductase